jgi:hypothetical protein
MNEQEQILRENIRQLIRHVKQKKLDEEKQIQESLQTLIMLELKNMLNEAETSDADPAPNKSTGINVLEDLLKKIIPVFRDDYKLMTTDEDQRDSFRSHIVKAIVDTLTPVEVNNKATVKEEINVKVDDADPDLDKFIDIRTDAEKAEEEEPPDEREEFGKGLEDSDKTGRNMAFNTFKKVQTSVIDAYELLDNPEDQEIFYDYLIANTKLYFDKFEDDLAGTVKEPTNQAYQDAKVEKSAEMGSEQAEEEPAPPAPKTDALEDIFEIVLD